MFVRLEDGVLHLHGGVIELNRLARSIHRARHGSLVSFDVLSEAAGFSVLIAECRGELAAVSVQGQEVHIRYSESVKNRLYTYFSMPSGTQPGSLFFLPSMNHGEPSLLVNGSLGLVVHVVADG